MNRRGFFKSALIGIAGLLGLGTIKKAKGFTAKPPNNTLTYNGVTIELTSVVFSRCGVLDNDHRFLIRSRFEVTGLVRGIPLSDEKTKELSERLLVPRRPLAVNVNGKELFGVSGIDCHNGPKPLQCNINLVGKADCRLVGYKIETMEPGLF